MEFIVLWKGIQYPRPGALNRLRLETHPRGSGQSPHAERLALSPGSSWKFPSIKNATRAPSTDSPGRQRAYGTIGKTSRQVQIIHGCLPSTGKAASLGAPMSKPLSGRLDVAAQAVLKPAPQENRTSRPSCHAIGPKRKMPGVGGRPPRATADDGATRHRSGRPFLVPAEQVHRSRMGYPLDG
jgi:hypothetical protein